MNRRAKTSPYDKFDMSIEKGAEIQNPTLKRLSPKSSNDKVQDLRSSADSKVIPAGHSSFNAMSSLANLFDENVAIVYAVQEGIVIEQKEQPGALS